MNSYKIYENGKPLDNLNVDKFDQIIKRLDKKYKSREFWTKNLIIRIYNVEERNVHKKKLIDVSIVDNKGGTNKSVKPNWTIEFENKNKNISIIAKLWDRKQQMKTVYVLWDIIKQNCTFDLNKEINNIDFKVLNSSGLQTQHSRLVEFFSKKENCNKLLKYSEVTDQMEKLGLKMVGRGIEGERPREFRYSMGYQFITNDKDKSVPSKFCKVISPFPTENRNERRAANADLEKKDWSETLNILKKGVKQLRCFYCGRFEGETNRIGQKTVFEKGHLQSHTSKGDVSKKNIIEQCKYCNTFLSNYFDFDPNTLKANINAEKAVEKANTVTKKKILDELLSKLLKKTDVKKILKKY